MLNRLILSLKRAGENHKQIREILIAPEADQAGTEYPLMRIWPAPRVMASEYPKVNRYEFLVTISDRHQDNGISAVEAISDSSQILEDILATLKYIYHDTLVVDWGINGTIDPFYDNPDVSAGVGANFYCTVPNNEDFCQVPSNDYDFPGLEITGDHILDEGSASSVYLDLVLDEGAA